MSSEKKGRPTEYKPEYAQRAFKLALLGCTDAQLAGVFDVTEQTINNWKLRYPEFFESIKSARTDADGEIAYSLYSRAKGHITEDGKIIPPDTTACIFWLKNRQGQYWRDKQEVQTEQTGTLTIKTMVPLPDPLPPELARGGD